MWLVEDDAVVQLIVCPKRQIGVGFECSSESDEMIAAAAGGVGECPEVTHSSAAASNGDIRKVGGLVRLVGGYAAMVWRYAVKRSVHVRVQ